MLEHIVITGRPNVGKSTLFNRLIGRRKALVHSIPGTTRDRNESIMTWKNKRFSLIDTGGWSNDSIVFSPAIKKQLEIALHKASLAMLIVDGKAGIHPLDVELAQFLRKSSKKLVLIVNKVDNAADELKTAEFYGLGIPDLVHISAQHGRNITELLEVIYGSIESSPENESLPDEENRIKVILVGKPNVGKSSLINKLSGEERSIVHGEPGTTREAFDVLINRDGRDFMLIDTPGLKKGRKLEDDMEYLASLSARRAMERANVAILVVDATQGICETEVKIAELILENRCACLIAINKWDLMEERETMVKTLRAQLEEKMPFFWWSKMTYVSAKTGQRTEKMLNEVVTIYNEYSKRVNEEELRETIREAQFRRPASRSGYDIKIRSVSQTGVKPPLFTIELNKPQLLHFSYKRYIENCIREKFGFDGTPISIRFVRAVRKKGTQ